MTFGKKKRSANLALAGVAILCILAAALFAQTAPFACFGGSPSAADIRPYFPNDSRRGEAELDRLPRSRQTIRTLVQLLSSDDPLLMSAAERSLHARFDELLATRRTNVSDSLASCLASELERQARDKQLPLGATDELVHRLLRWPFLDEALPAIVAPQCLHALQLTAAKQR